MRKSLYMTTALAAAGMLAFGATGAVAGSHTGGKIKIGLGGFLNTYVGEIKLTRLVQLKYALSGIRAVLQLKNTG